MSDDPSRELIRLAWCWPPRFWFRTELFFSFSHPSTQPLWQSPDTQPLIKRALYELETDCRHCHSTSRHSSPTGCIAINYTDYKSSLSSVSNFLCSHYDPLCCADMACPTQRPSSSPPPERTLGGLRDGGGSSPLDWLVGTIGSCPFRLFPVRSTGPTKRVQVRDWY